jgi:hypothetical protein
MVVSRLTLWRRVLAVQVHAISATFVMTPIAIHYQYKGQRQLQRAGWRGLAQGLLYSGHHRDRMLSISSCAHSNQTSEETLPCEILLAKVETNKLKQPTPKRRHH